MGQQLGLPGSCEDVCPGKAQPVIAQRLDQLRNVEQDIILEGGREGGRLIIDRQSMCGHMNEKVVGR